MDRFPTALIAFFAVFAAGAFAQTPENLVGSDGDSFELFSPEIVVDTGLPDYTDEAGKVLTVKSDETGIEWTTKGSGGGGASTFTGLTDTPANYTGSGGKIPAVNSGETALEFIDAPSGGATAFTGLTDTPANYTGSGGQFLAVNSGATAIEFVNAPSGGGVAPENTIGGIETEIGSGRQNAFLNRALNADVTVSSCTITASQTLSIQLSIGTRALPSTTLNSGLFVNTVIPGNNTAVDILHPELGNRVIFRITRASGSSCNFNLAWSAQNISDPFYTGTRVNYTVYRIDPFDGNFTGLLDTPNSLASQKGKIVAVNSGETALEFIAAPSPPPSPSDTNPTALGTATAGSNATYSRSDHRHPTTGLRQVPVTRSSNANQCLRASADGSTYLWSTCPGGTGGSSTFTGLTDTPANYTGDAGDFLVVNGDADAVNFLDSHAAVLSGLPAITGRGGQVLTVNTAASAIEWKAASGGGGGGGSAPPLLGTFTWSSTGAKEIQNDSFADYDYFIFEGWINGSGSSRNQTFTTAIPKSSIPSSGSNVSLGPGPEVPAYRAGITFNSTSNTLTLSPTPGQPSTRGVVRVWGSDYPIGGGGGGGGSSGPSIPEPSGASNYLRVASNGSAYELGKLPYSNIGAVKLGAAAAGTSDNLSRADHVHPKTDIREVPATSSSNNDYCLRSTGDGSYAFENNCLSSIPSFGSDVQPLLAGNTNAAGADDDIARTDHVHRVATFTGTPSAAGVASAGTSDSFARGDHVHATNRTNYVDIAASTFQHSGGGAASVNFAQTGAAISLHNHLISARYQQMIVLMQYNNPTDGQILTQCNLAGVAPDRVINNQRTVVLRGIQVNAPGFGRCDLEVPPSGNATLSWTNVGEGGLNTSFRWDLYGVRW